MAEVRIETDQPILRTWQDDDRPAFAAIHRDPQAMRYPGTGLADEPGIGWRLARDARGQGHPARPDLDVAHPEFATDHPPSRHIVPGIERSA